MKNRQYYINKETNEIYKVVVCVGDSSNCIVHIDDFWKNHTTDEVLYIFSDEYSEMKEYYDELPEDIKNYIFQYSGQTMKGALAIVDHINTSRMEYDPLQPWNKQTRKKNIQTVFNITEKYLRESKLNRILNG